MDRRLLAIGLGTALAGLGGLLALTVGGVVQHPAAAAYGPAELAALAGSFLALTVGVVVTFRSLVVLPDPDR